MDYELLKKLKDAGFPQKLLPITKVYVGICKHGIYGFSEGRESCDCGEKETAHKPTLEELIGACGLKHQTLFKKDNGDWCTFGYSTSPSGEGATPSEAVANLWLALNEK